MSYVFYIPLVLLFSVYDATFEQGNEAYQQGDYTQAIQSYEQLIYSGVAEPEVFYNLATAYYREGRVGAAVVNYERALYLQPEFGAARDNLGRVLRDTERNLPRPVTSSFMQNMVWNSKLSSRSLLIVTSISWIAFWSLLFLRLWRPLPYLRLVAAVFLFVAVVNGTAAYGRVQPSPLAVAIEERVPARFGTSDSEQVRFELYEGDRVLIDRIEGDWIRVVTASGERGWVRFSQLLEVGPPFRTLTADNRNRE